jgi:hypothetical protein
MFEKIQAKCPWRDIDLWRNGADMCSANNRPCCEKNCAIYKALMENLSQGGDPSYKELLLEVYKNWNKTSGGSDLYMDKDNITLTLATGGWSENEKIIDSLWEDKTFWTACCKIENIQKGYYQFKV